MEWIPCKYYSFLPQSHCDVTDVQLYIDMRSIPDLLVQTSTSKGITVGASVTLTNFIELLETTIQSGGKNFVVLRRRKII